MNPKHPMIALLAVAALVCARGGAGASEADDAESRALLIRVEADPPPPPPPPPPPRPRIEVEPPPPPPPTIRMYMKDGSIFDIPMSVILSPKATTLSALDRYKVGSYQSGAPAVPKTDVNYGKYGALNGGVSPKR